MTTTPRLVTTQADLDAALAEGVTDLIVDAPAGAYLEIRHDFVRLWGSSSAVLWGSSSAELRESSRAVLWESSRAELWGSSRAELWGSSRAVLRESSSAELWGSSRAELRESSSAELWGSSRAVLWESSRAELWGSSRAVLRESSRAVLRESSSAELWGSSSAELRESSRAELWESSSAETGRWTVVHVWSQRVTLTGEGHVIDMAQVDLTDVDTWRAYVGLDTLARPDRDRLIVGHVSSQDHEGRLHKDGQIKIGCFYGTPAELRELAAGDDWPSHADADDRDKYRPRLLAFADLCDAQMAAWAEAAQ